jgi:hypothetical protein
MLYPTTDVLSDLNKNLFIVWKLQLVWKLDFNTIPNKDPHYFHGKDFEKFPVKLKTL